MIFEMKKSFEDQAPASSSENLQASINLPAKGLSQADSALSKAGNESFPHRVEHFFKELGPGLITGAADAVLGRRC